MPRLFVEHLTVLDFAYLDAERGLVGDSWIVDLELDGKLDKQGMVLDFGAVKSRLKRVLDGAADHRLLVPGRSPLLQLVRSGKRSGLAFKAATGAIEHQSPLKAIAVIDAEAITLESLGAHLQAALRKALPKTLAASLTLRHEAIDGALYQYTHGLRKHAGACQRIAHGHRSRLEVSVNGRRDPRLERQLAEHWRDVYLGSSPDVVAHGKGRIRFAYRSREGEFELELPAERCDLLPTDSTVERIAEHLAARATDERPRAKIQVRAYEGVMKGAVAEKG
jgi:6-pyruvoyl-tetrahydropterin synthase